MVSWQAFEGDDAAWDALVSELQESNVFQSSLWARHKAASGWRALRVTSGLAAAQALVREMPAGARLLWARGGPVGDPRAWDGGLPGELLRLAGGCAAYVRICPYRPRDAAGLEALARAGWLRPKTPLNATTTYRLRLDAGTPLEPTANWAHNLRRGLARSGPAQAWDRPDAAEMERLYLALESYKGIAPQHRAPSLASLVSSLGPRLIVRRVVQGGTTVAMRACGVFGEVAMDLLAAATPEARRVYASYVLLAALVEDARRLGARVYDLGGADPGAAKGVADFKKGTGAEPVETLGEWDAAAPALARRPIGALIAARMAA